MQTFAQLDVYRRRADAAFFWGGLFVLIALAVLLGALPAFAQTPGASSGPADPSTEQLMQLVRFAGGAFKAGAWFAAIIACIIVLVFALRLYGKRLHELIPDDSAADKPFYFLFDTKPGGVILNGFTAAGLVLTPVLLSGQVPFTPTLAGVTVLAGVGASQFYGWAKDLYEWWKSRKPDPAAAQAAGLKAVEKPGSGVDA